VAGNARRLDGRRMMQYAVGMTEIGRHVAVYGATGSGKTTFAARLARCLGAAHIELDAIHWLPDWVEKPLDEFRADVLAALERCPDGWVCDGNYSKVRDLVLPLADSVVWLRLPLRVTFWRLLLRSASRARRREPLWGTNSASWRLMLFSRDSLLLYALTAGRHAGEKARRLRESIPPGTAVRELRSVREVEAFLSRVCAEEGKY